MKGFLKTILASLGCFDGKLSMNLMMSLRIASLAGLNSSFPSPPSLTDVHCAARFNVWPMVN